MIRRFGFAVSALLAGLLLLACAPGTVSQTTDTTTSRANPVDAVELTQPVEILFWHRQTGTSDELQQKLIDQFNATNQWKIKVSAESLVDYNRLYQKILAAVQAGATPDVVAAFENQAGDYYDAGAVVPFDDYIGSTKYGLTATDLADYNQAFLEATKFPQYQNQRLTFPYTKSDLLLYTNMEVLRSLGFSKPAVTWDEFLTHTRAAVAAGKQGYGMEVSASTFDGIVFSYGGDVVSPDGKLLFDKDASLKTLQLYDTLIKEKLAYQIQGNDDTADLAAGKTLYAMRSSTSIPFLKRQFNDDTKWEVSIIPQGQSTKPATVLYGANISIMKSTPERQLASWLFIKWFSEKEQTAAWGLNDTNGYFAVRNSALTEPAAKTYLDANPHFKKALEVSANGRVEPSIRGWQEIRTVIQDAVTGVITGRLTPQAASQQMMTLGNKILSEL
jgi:ABC-type glycerol-3-phosphate transport system substrate-binding protein